MDHDLAEAVRLELLLLEPDVRNDADQVRRLLHPNFCEYGSSGRVWDRDSITKATGTSSEPIAATALSPRRLGPNAVLLTYVSEASGRSALRSSTWVRHDSRWLLLFHQGTPTAA